jgi:hypothetical protein
MVFKILDVGNDLTRWTIDQLMEKSTDFLRLMRGEEQEQEEEKIME